MIENTLPKGFISKMKKDKKIINNNISNTINNNKSIN